MEAQTVDEVQKDATQGQKLEKPWKGWPFTNFGWGYFIPNITLSNSNRFLMIADLIDSLKLEDL